MVRYVKTAFWKQKKNTISMRESRFEARKFSVPGLSVKRNHYTKRTVKSIEFQHQKMKIIVFFALFLYLLFMSNVCAEKIEGNRSRHMLSNTRWTVFEQCKINIYFSLREFRNGWWTLSSRLLQISEIYNQQRGVLKLQM